MTDTTLIQRLSDEADLCRSDGATDVAKLLDDAVYEIVRLRSALKRQEDREGHIGTHSHDCHKFGPSHYDCALRKIEAQRADAERLRHLLQASMTAMQHSRFPLDWAVMITAIDAALRQEQPAGEGEK